MRDVCPTASSSTRRSSDSSFLDDSSRSMSSAHKPSSSIEDLFALDSTQFLQDDDEFSFVDCSNDVSPDEMSILMNNLDFDQNYSSFNETNGASSFANTDEDYNLSVDALYDYHNQSETSSSRDSGKNSPSESSSEAASEYSPWSLTTHSPGFSPQYSQQQRSRHGEANRSYSQVIQGNSTQDQNLQQSNVAQHQSAQLPKGNKFVLKHSPSSQTSNSSTPVNFYSSPPSTPSSQSFANAVPIHNVRTQAKISPTSHASNSVPGSKVLYLVGQASTQPLLLATPITTSTQTVLVKTVPNTVLSSPQTSKPTINSGTTFSSPVISSSQPVILQTAATSMTTKSAFVDPRDTEMQRRQEDRKIRNRASAQASRIRKKNEYDEMKIKITTLEEENDKLKVENKELRERLAQYANQGVEEIDAERSFIIEQTPYGQPPSRKRRAVVAGACLMAICLLVAMPINLSGYGNKVSRASYRQREAAAAAALPASHSRVITTDDDYVVPDEDVSTALDNMTNGSVGCDGQYGAWLNKTETMRLNIDLYDWVERHEQLLDVKRIRRGKKVQLRPRKEPPGWERTNQTDRIDVKNDEIYGGNEKKMRKGASTATNYLKNEKNSSTTTNSRRTVDEKRAEAKERAVRDRAWKHLDMISQNSDSLREKREKARRYAKWEKEWEARQILENQQNNGLAGSKPTKEQFEKLTYLIQQRPDTLYMVTMKEYLLFPAVERNATSRPRLSIIIPAHSWNGTVTDQIPLMRIECDVVGTGLFNLSDAFLSIFFN